MSSSLNLRINMWRKHGSSFVGGTFVGGTLLELLQSHDCPVGWGCRIHRLHLCRGVTPHQQGYLLVVGNGMLEDGILVAEQYLTQKLKRSLDLQHSTLALTGLDGWSEKPDATNRLVMPAPF